jgi:hypothetical protein
MAVKYRPQEGQRTVFRGTSVPHCSQKKRSFISPPWPPEDETLQNKESGVGISAKDRLPK